MVLMLMSILRIMAMMIHPCRIGRLACAQVVIITLDVECGHLRKKKDTDDETDDDNDHKKDSYTAAGAAPDVGAAPIQTRYDKIR